MRPSLAPLAALVACAFAALAFPAASQSAPLYPDLSGAPLRDTLRRDFAPSRTLGYDPARDSLYTYRQRVTGAVCGVYTGFCITLTPGQDASTSAFQQNVNAEHSWPQSRGAENEPQRSDLHIIFPAKANVNSSRGNHPYAEVPDAQAQAWYRLADSQSHTPTMFLDEWSERTDSYPGTPYAARWEPREDAAGDIARAVAYFAVVYESAVDAYGERRFLTTMLADLQAWNTQDPPSDAERAESAWAAVLQGADNPFVVDPTLLDRAFADNYGAPTDGPGTPGDTRPGDERLWVNEVHYDNTGTDQGEFVELAGPAGTDLSGWRLVLYNGNGGAVYDDRALSGTLPDQDQGLGTLAFSYPANGIQNGPDGIALVDPSGAVTQFLSYEGVFNATDGPTAGLVSTDIDVEEAGSTPTNYSLGLVGTGRQPTDFTWSGPSPVSPGALNVGQTARRATPTAEDPGPLAVALGPPVPNPSRADVQFALSLAAPSPARATIIDALGRVVAVVQDIPLAGGPLAVRTATIAPGVYVLRLVTASGTASRRFTVVR